MNETSWIFAAGAGLVLHLLLIAGTVGMAAEKNRKPLLWLPLAVLLSPITFLILLFIGYSPRNQTKNMGGKYQPLFRQ
ncbi:MAG: hypothetical protein KCHDKBKB_02047 [Elusimicrobia bacterium]|nr:hypothetical protein [Elusimicrobiota bacterium]